MNNRTLYRVRVEDLNDDVRNEVAELLRAGDSAKAIKQLDHFGFLEPSSVEATYMALRWLRHSCW